MAISASSTATIWLLSFPAFVCQLVLFALVESVWRWFTGLGLIPWLRRRTGRSLSSTAFDEFTAVVNGNKTVEVEQRRVELLLRDDEGDGAPPRSTVDLAQGTAFIVMPQEADSSGARRRAALEGRRAALEGRR
ncbi:DUF6191 domain-containing protein [Streptomyces flavofungini]|uniref:Uncharacterized protein n=1 Tax=Streptomyces flavofungini TaxID=68200 RepID=A0ABS0X7Q0_9ACTN|nr:DUF6191 domain-containing protein [Streptomyces flavofungini]MBJ3809237.1 hypothetical protein [Streptomyces flavofungini]GHC77092.1 hypothetical protein GCM10010349_57460 [Streptomyces flavofungini]